MQVLSSRILITGSDFDRSRRVYEETIGLDIYREYYAASPLADIWDKISNVLEDHGLAAVPAVDLG